MVGLHADFPSRYGRTKLGNILFARELAKRKINDPNKPVLVMSVHPGMVDTEVQSAWTESYGALGKLLELGSKLFGKTAPEGAEASLWAATGADIFEGNWKDFQVSISGQVAISYEADHDIRVTIIQSPTESHIPKPIKPRARNWPTTIGIFLRNSSRRSSVRTSLEGRCPSCPPARDEPIVHVHHTERSLDR